MERRTAGGRRAAPVASQINWKHVERRHGPVPTVEQDRFMPLADASRRLQRRGFDVLAFNSAASMAYDNALPVVRLADGRYGVDPASVEAERVRRQRASFSQKLVSMGGRMAWGVIGGLFHR